MKCFEKEFEKGNVFSPDQYISLTDFNKPVNCFITAAA